MATTATATTTTTQSSSSENDEAVLLRDWDIERFFTNSPRNSSSEKSSSNTPPNMTVANNNNKNNRMRSNGDGGNENNGVRGNVGPSRDALRIEEYYNKNNVLEEKVKHDLFANNIKPKNDLLIRNQASADKTAASNKGISGHKRQDSDSKISLNFVRNFRRENSDFFPLSKRHSAILVEQSSANNKISGGPAAAQQRSSGIFQRNRLSKGEPILTDYHHIKSRDSELFINNDNNKKITATGMTGQHTTNNLSAPKQSVTQQQQPAQQRQSTPFSKNLDFLRPRREKTESVIVVRNSTTRQLLFNQQQVNLI